MKVWKELPCLGILKERNPMNGALARSVIHKGSTYWVNDLLRVANITDNSIVNKFNKLIELVLKY